MPICRRHVHVRCCVRVCENVCVAYCHQYICIWVCRYICVSGYADKYVWVGMWGRFWHICINAYVYTHVSAGSVWMMACTPYCMTHHTDLCYVCGIDDWWHARHIAWPITQIYAMFVVWIMDRMHAILHDPTLLVVLSCIWTVSPTMGVCPVSVTRTCNICMQGQSEG